MFINTHCLNKYCCDNGKTTDLNPACLNLSVMGMCIYSGKHAFIDLLSIDN